MKFNRTIILVFFLFISITSFGSVPVDSIVKPAKTKFIYEEDVDKELGHYTTPDSSLNNIQRYRNRYNLGNVGLATTNLYFPVFQPALGFNFAPNNFRDYTYQPHKMEYYDTRTPFTELFFSVGSKKELNSRFIHSQNVNKNLNFGFNFQRIRSDGFYNRQNTDHTDLALSGNYRSSNKRYFLISNIILNSLKNAENGGITNDSIFENMALRDRKLLATNLVAANRKQRSRSVYLKQYINLGPKINGKDSTEAAHVLPTSVLSHSILAQDEFFSYSDLSPTSGFYNHIYNDSVRTFDSTYMFRVENELAWRMLENKKDGTSRKIGFQLGAKHQFIKLGQYTGRDTLNQTSKLSDKKLYGRTIENIIANAELFNFNTSRFAYDLRGEYVISGFNAGDNSLNLNLNYNLSDSTQTVGFSGSIVNRKPDDIYMNYYSNHYTWHNVFGQISYMNARMFYRSVKYDLEIGGVAHQYTNYVYFDENRAAQEASTIQGFSGYLYKSFHFKHIGFSNKITYQYIPDSLVIRLPQWATEHSLYYQGSLFKNALKFQIGFDVFYNTSYYANAWSPALGQFYLQGKKQIGNYPYVDVFLNMKISRARIFIKYENVSSFLGYFNYYYAPHYPWTDGALKFGIVWRFFD
jgi:hypothetical protein